MVGGARGMRGRKYRRGAGVERAAAAYESGTKKDEAVRRAAAPRKPIFAIFMIQIVFRILLILFHGSTALCPTPLTVTILRASFSA